jgi:archaellum component FlaC
MLLSMAVTLPRERWTDEQLDKAFGRIDGDIGEMRVEMKQRFEKVDLRFEQVDQRFEQIDKRFEQIDRRFERVEDKFDGMQRNMTTWFIALFASIVVSPLISAFAASIT